MRAVGKIRLVARRLLSPIAGKFFPVRWKEFNELSYWKQRKVIEGELSNRHYRYFYTIHFGLDESFYAGKTILDIGCGPRGSLEWADMTARRIGLDPLADKYAGLGADRHRMEYLSAPSESIPLPDESCDVVASFNSLDHVKDVSRTLNEIARVTRPGGLFLLLVEVNHPPTDCEPHQLTPAIVQALQPRFTCAGVQVFQANDKGIYNSIRANLQLPDPQNTREIGYLSARFVRTTVGAPIASPGRQ